MTISSMRITQVYYTCVVNLHFNSTKYFTKPPFVVYHSCSMVYTIYVEYIFYIHTLHMLLLPNTIAFSASHYYDFAM